METDTQSMIKASEIRLGNCFFGVTKCGVGNPVRIDKISYDVDMARVVPILLTPKILEKCGFEKEHHYLRKGVVYVFEKMNVELYPDDGRESIPLKIQYLHQLQNLYFALTCEELEINL
ncbi:MAG: hypothetical protein QOC35_06410 [Nitrososphaeraceae archaeon]|nr:hypothetical protein [Nitrososphaeraceae archaeon]